LYVDPLVETVIEEPVIEETVLEITDPVIVESNPDVW
jgi:hypothetical protein